MDQLSSIDNRVSIQSAPDPVADALGVEAMQALPPDLPPRFALSALDGSNGFRIDSGAQFAGLGRAVAGVGDVNGDGIADILLGAPGAEGNKGSAYVLFGGALGSAAAFSVADLDGSNGFQIIGHPGENVGGSVARAGDVNGDGIADMLIGAPHSSVGGSQSGSTYVVFGSTGAAGAGLDLTSLDGANGFRIDGVAKSLSGYSTAAAGDVNGDGIGDIVIGALGDTSGGGAYVVFGKTTGFDAVMSLADLDGSDGFKIKAVGSQDETGQSVSSAGDINGDGIDDLIVGAPFATPDHSVTGAAYVVFGQSGGFDATVDLSKLDGSDGFTLTTDWQLGSLGWSVASAGDVNGDGFDDLIVGAPETTSYDFSGYVGASYLIYGKASGFGAQLDLDHLTAADGARFNGGGDQHTGWSLASAGDFNGDGFDDLIISAPFAYGSRHESGAAYLVYGQGAAFTFPVQLTDGSQFNGLEILGVLDRDEAGLSVSSAGDLNGDGLDDLLIGAPMTDNDGYASGSAYVVYGKLAQEAVTRIGTAASQHLVGGSFDDVLSGMGGDDLLIGNGGADTLTGGEGDDTISAGDGVDTVVFSGDHADYRIIALGDGRAVFTDLRDGSPDGTDLVSGAESFVFADGTLSASELFYTLHLRGGAPDHRLVEAGVAGAGVDTAVASAIGAFHAVGAVSFNLSGWTQTGASTYSHAGVYGAAVLDISTGVVSYTLDNADADTQALALGQTASDDFTVALHDQGGGSGSTVVGFQVIGRDDAPVLSGGQVSTVLVEAGADGAGVSAASASAILVSDPDAGDEPAFGLRGWHRVGVTDAYTRAGVYGTATLNIDTGVVSYALNNADKDTQALNSGDVVTDGFQITVSDGHGGSASTTVVFTIQGDYDSPVGTTGDDVLAGDGHDDLIDGGKGNDSINGAGGDDSLLGSAGQDSLNGGLDNDRLSGGLGADELTGGLGKDVFAFTGVNDSWKKGLDLITDLTKADVIDVSAIDADTAKGGDQAFHLVSAFSHHAGELTVSYDAETGLTMVRGDVDGNGKADLMISIAGDLHSFTNFVL